MREIAIILQNVTKLDVGTAGTLINETWNRLKCKACDVLLCVYTHNEDDCCFEKYHIDPQQH